MQEITSEIESEIQSLLEASNQGENPDWKRIIDLTYTRIKSIAQRLIGFQNGDHSLGATALVSNTFLKLAENHKTGEINDVRHLLAYITKTMRNEISDHYRKKQRLKRGGTREVHSFDVIGDSIVAQTCAPDEFSEYLDALDSRASRAIQMRIYLKYTTQEIALVLGCSTSTVENDIRYAKAELRKMLARDDSRFSTATGPQPDLRQP